MDDPVSLHDPSGLLGAAVKQGVKHTGKSLGKSLFNDELSSAEKMFEVRDRIIENELNIKAGIATEDDIKQLREG